MQISATDRLFVLTGAGVSAESGLATFRGDGGLWRTYRAEEVANIAAWHRDPRLVWEFYSMRRRKALAAKPNPAHVALAEIEAQLASGSSCAPRTSILSMSRRGRCACNTSMAS